MGSANRDEVGASTTVASLIRAANRQGVRASQLLRGVGAPLSGVDEVAGIDAESARDCEQLRD